MQLSETVKLIMTKEQKVLVEAMMDEYIRTVNRLVSVAANDISIDRYTSASVKAKLPSALKNQCIREAKSIINKYKKECQRVHDKAEKPNVPILKKPCCYINNQNFKINNNNIEFPAWKDDKSKRISVHSALTDRQKDKFQNAKFGTMRIVCKGKKIVAQIVYETTETKETDGGNVMGVDLGIKCPAVSYVSDGSVKFHGNGRKNKYIRRHYRQLRRRLQKGKHTDALKRINNKEQRIMKDTDHKISRRVE